MKRYLKKPNLNDLVSEPIVDLLGDISKDSSFSVPFKPKISPVISPSASGRGSGSYFGSSDDRKVVPDTLRPESIDIDTDWIPDKSTSDDRRDSEPLTYDEWLERQTSNGWPKWLLRWVYPREQYNLEDGAAGFKNMSAAMLALFGLATGNSWLPSLMSSFKGSSESAQSGKGSGFLSWLSGSGSGSGSGLFSGLSDSLFGFGSQYASSVLNYQNMEKLIDKQNAYNTPSAQMQRFADAGLNPNLVYGLGSNGNQPASGSIAPVDFDTSQRENRMARMQIDTQTKMANADVAQKMSAVNLNEANSKLANENANNMAMQNQLYFANWCNEQAIKIAQYKEIINRIDNDNKRVAMEKELNDAEVLLKGIQSQSRSNVGAVASDIISWMQRFTEFMNEVTKDMSQPSDFGFRSDSYDTSPTSKDSKFHPLVPPGYNGR